MKALIFNYLKISLAIAFTVMAVTSEPFAGEAVSVGLPPLPGEIMKEVDNNLTSQQLSPQGVFVYDTVYFNFDSTLEGWDFTFHPDTVHSKQTEQIVVQRDRSSHLKQVDTGHSMDLDLDGVVEGKHDSLVSSILSKSLSPADTGDVVHTIPTPGPSCQGLTWDGNYLWVSDIVTNLIYKVSPIDGTVLQSFPSPANLVEGLAWDGTYLWASANDTDMFFQMNPLNGAVIMSFAVTAYWVHGITWVNQYLWANDFYSKLIYKIDPLTGTLLTSIPAPGDSSIGLTWDGQYLWADDFGNDQLYQIDLANGSIIRSVVAPHSNPRDLAWDGQYIWVVSWEADTIYKVDVGYGAISRTWYVNTAGNDTTGDGSLQYPFATIQAGINASKEDDTILVAQGTYKGYGNRDLYIQGRSIVLKSESGPELTIIDCEGSSGNTHTGLSVYYDTTGGVVVDGFTFRRAYGDPGYPNAGIYLYSSHSTIRNCVFENNTLHGVYCSSSNPVISNCVFVGNSGDFGGGLYCFYSTPDVKGCLFDGNSAQAGGAVYNLFGGATLLTNCTFVNNSADSGGVILFGSEWDWSSITNCLLAFNTKGGAIYVAFGTLSLSCCDVYGNAGGDWVGDIADQYGVNGNFSRDPLFCDFANGDYQVTENSPCAPANNSCKALIGAYGVGCGAIEIVLSPTSIDFFAVEGEDNPPPDTLTITNAGGGVLTWTLSKSAEWLSVSDSMGTAPSTVIVSADISGLTAGVYTDTIIVGAEDAINSPQYVPVTLTVQVAGEIALSPDSMHFSADSGGTNPDPQNLTITNAGGGTLICTLTTNTAWIILSDTVVTAPSTVTVSADITGLSPGQYPGIITVSSDDATNSPQYVPITLTIDTANRPPEFVQMCNDTVLVEGQKFECEIAASDPDEDLIDFMCQDCPDGAMLTNINATTALFSFEPDYRHVDSSYTVIIEASDGAATVSDSFTISVVNQQLKVISIQPHSGEGQDILISWKPIQVQFNEAVQEDSLDTGLALISKKGDALTHTYNPDQYLLTFDNASDYLMSLDTIICTLRTSILDMAGNPLDSEYVYEFYTGVAVFPGDANDDGTVDERDILPMGLYWGNGGPLRTDSGDVSWGTKPAHVYASGKRWAPLASVYADADGSGKVDADDICGVTNNWARQVASGKLADLDIKVDLETASKQFEGSVLQQMYEALTNCPESEGKESVMRAFESLLDEPAANLPETYELCQNYPNPFNPNTVIRFYLPQSGHASLSVYNIIGRKVAVLLDAYLDKGYGEVTWDGADQSGQLVASGIYFYRLEGGDVTITKRMMLLK